MSPEVVQDDDTAFVKRRGERFPDDAEEASADVPPSYAIMAHTTVERNGADHGEHHATITRDDLDNGLAARAARVLPCHRRVRAG